MGRPRKEATANATRQARREYQRKYYREHKEKAKLYQIQYNLTHKKKKVGYLIHVTYSGEDTFQRLLVTSKTLLYLVRLSVARFIPEFKDGWLPVEDIEEGHNQGRYVYRIKQELNATGSVFIQNRKGFYRISPQVRNIRLASRILKKHPDHRISGIFKGEER